MADASATLAPEAGNGAVARGRLTDAGAAALAALRRFDRSPLSHPPEAGAGEDTAREGRHDVRAAAQGVLAQLELIALAWRSWSASTRDAMLDELGGAAADLEQRVRHLLGE